MKRNQLQSYVKCLILILGGVVYSACQPIPSTRFESTVTGPAPSLVITSTLPLIDHNNDQGLSITPSLPIETKASFATKTIDPLPLVFPTVVQEDGAEYRPPLYPIPWARAPFDHFLFSTPINASYPGDPVWDYRYGGILFGPDIIHSGVDLPAPRNAEVLAAGSGIVTWSGIGLYSGALGNKKDPYGLAVAIQHDFGFRNEYLWTVYAHLEDIFVIPGQPVNIGEVIGLVGSSGMTTGPHLHFEVRWGENDFWKTFNPELWIVPPLDYGVLVGSIKSTYGTNLESYLVYITNLETKKAYPTTTYAALTVNSDPYYQENLVLGDLPAGIYEINIPYGALNRKVEIQIKPGAITYFSFRGFNGYDFTLPGSPAFNP